MITGACLNGYLSKFQIYHSETHSAIIHHHNTSFITKINNHKFLFKFIEFKSKIRTKEQQIFTTKWKKRES